MSQHREVARHLLQIKAIKLSPQNPFTWASGRKSPIYCDNRIVLSHPNVRSYVREQLAVSAGSFGQIDGIAGVATAGIAHGALLADHLDLPFIYVRSKPKAHGRQNQIEGELHVGARYLMVEDLISTGGSSLQAVEAVRAAGGLVSGVLAIFSYGFEEAAKAFEQAECRLQTLSHYDALIAEAAETGYVDADQLSLLTSWRRDPVAWSEAIG